MGLNSPELPLKFTKVKIKFTGRLDASSENLFPSCPTPNRGSLWVLKQRAGDSPFPELHVHEPRFNPWHLSSPFSLCSFPSRHGIRYSIQNVNSLTRFSHTVNHLRPRGCCEGQIPQGIPHSAPLLYTHTYHPVTKGRCHYCPLAHPRYKHFQCSQTVSLDSGDTPLTSHSMPRPSPSVP